MKTANTTQGVGVRDMDYKGVFVAPHPVYWFPCCHICVAHFVSSPAWMVGQQRKTSLKFNSEEWALQFSLHSCSTIALTGFVVFFHPPSVVPHPHPHPALHRLKRKSLFLPPLPGSNLSHE